MNSNLFFAKRPTFTEDDDDILLLREEFLQKRTTSSTKCVRVGGASASDGREKETVISVDEDPGQSQQVLFDVMERDVSGFQVPVHPVAPKTFPPQNFAKVNKSSQKSIFLQHLERDRLPEKTPQKFSPSTEFAKPTETPHSFVIDGSGLGGKNGSLEAQKLHEENAQRVAAMSAEDIAKFQKELAHTLSPETIDFLKSCRKKENDLSNKTRQSSVAVNSVKKQNPLSGDPYEVILKESGGCCKDGLIWKEIIEDPREESTISDVINKNIDTTLTTQTNDFKSKDLPIDPNSCGQWLNMDVVETDKLAWMTPLPKSKPIDAKTGYTARFDFKGNLLRRDVDLPTQLGLHHHSHEPEVAGYSIEELFLLSRSSFQAQRVTALQTLANILENYWEGRFDNCFDCSLLSTLLQAGLAPLLRWALDDNPVPSVIAATLAIHSLLVPKTDELCLDWTFCWSKGHFSPFLTAETSEECLNMKELTDANVIKLDVITGFLRMDLLSRLRYILRVACPSSSVCQLLLEICIRIARHSTSSAKEIAEYPLLMDAIFQKFLPVRWKFANRSITTATDYSPLTSAVKLVRIIASADKELALLMLKKYHIQDSMESYIAIDPNDGLLPFYEYQKLVLENLKLWQTMLSYGFCTIVVPRLFSVFYRQLLFCEKLYLRSSIECNISNHDYTSHLIKSFECFLMAAHFLNNNKQEISLICANEGEIDWENLHKISEMICNCLQHWLQEYPMEEPCMFAETMLATAINYMSTYCIIFQKDESKLTLMDKVFTNLWHQFLSSNNFSKALHSLSSHSLLLCKEKSGCERDTKGLPSLGCILWKSCLPPVFKKSSHLPLIMAVFRCLDVCGTINPSMQIKALSVLPSALIKDYLHNLASVEVPFSNWFCHFEVQLICSIINVYRKQAIIDVELLYRVCVKLVPCIGSSNEVLLRQLFETVVFDKTILRNIRMESSEMLESIDLVEICNFYCDYFISSKKLEESRSCDFQSLSFELGKEILPSIGWPLIPLFKLYKASKSRTPKELASPQDRATIVNSLKWFLLNQKSGEWSTMSPVPDSVLFIHLCMVYLIDSEAFHDKEIKNLLSACLCNILKRTTKMDLVDIKWKQDTPDFEEIYCEMLVQFEALSYGDKLFCIFILVPLQQCYPSSWKLLLLDDHEQIIRYLNVPLEELKIPIEAYLKPYETNESVLQKYFMLLSSEKITSQTSPLLYLMAVHHLQHHLLEGDKSNEEFWKQIAGTKAHDHIMHHQISF